MFSALINLFRLARAGVMLAWHGVHFLPDGPETPAPARLLRRLLSPLKARKSQPDRLSNALVALGPSYIKLGQFLATRRDTIGAELANDLAQLQDQLPPFPMEEAKKAIREALGKNADDIFIHLSEPIAAASIAQVHRARIRDTDGTERDVAVKILRPNIEKRFRRDLESFYFAARLIEFVHKPSRRLRPIAVVDTLAEWTRLEMDLRLEAAAMSEMSENTERAGDPAFRIPKVDWEHTSARVMTVEWVDAIPIANLTAIERAGIDREALGNHVIRSFLRHAMRDGFFHADMHQGNLFVDPDGTLVPVDFGIMGRLGPKEKRFLAEILYGFIMRDYLRSARMHLEAGYVPPHYSVEAFAQALRSIGEPIKDRTADDISMAKLLSQLFEITELFDMKTRPELLLLQKTMVAVEGVARMLDPKLNMWTAAEPVVKSWMEEQIGPRARLNEAVDGLTALASLVKDAPKLAEQARRISAAVDENESNAGLQLYAGASGPHDSHERAIRSALWVGAIALAAIAVKLWV
ncbi:MAG: 2-polyprenylphenol 6-hydroxylase [Hyphomicrobiales bacterium]|nr:2-polyprenylphenol 6-hydroxylase [Hyphomicrobiales bacterium]